MGGDERAEAGVLLGDRRVGQLGHAFAGPIHLHLDRGQGRVDVRPHLLAVGAVRGAGQPHDLLQGIPCGGGPDLATARGALDRVHGLQAEDQGLANERGGKFRQTVRFSKLGVECGQLVRVVSASLDQRLEGVEGLGCELVDLSAQFFGGLRHQGVQGGVRLRELVLGVPEVLLELSPGVVLFPNVAYLVVTEGLAHLSGEVGDLLLLSAADSSSAALFDLLVVPGQGRDVRFSVLCCGGGCLFVSGPVVCPTCEEGRLVCAVEWFARVLQGGGGRLGLLLDAGLRLEGPCGRLRRGFSVVCRLRLRDGGSGLVNRGGGLVVCRFGDRALWLLFGDGVRCLGLRGLRGRRGQRRLRGGGLVSDPDRDGCGLLGRRGGSDLSWEGVRERADGVDPAEGADVEAFPGSGHRDVGQAQLVLCGQDEFAGLGVFLGLGEVAPDLDLVPFAALGLVGGGDDQFGAGFLVASFLRDQVADHVDQALGGVAVDEPYERLQGGRVLVGFRVLLDLVPVLEGRELGVLGAAALLEISGGPGDVFDVPAAADECHPLAGLESREDSGDGTDVGVSQNRIGLFDGSQDCVECGCAFQTEVGFEESEVCVAHLGDGGAEPPTLCQGQNYLGRPVLQSIDGTAEFVDRLIAVADDDDLGVLVLDHLLQHGIDVLGLVEEDRVEVQARV
ncbi:hypothetical protein SALBM311S_08688 [Streptomyces alboniger]